MTSACFAKLTPNKAYFGMQCFWGSESRFARVIGVVGTKVGYAGGKKLNPTYKDIGDHTEVVEVTYNPAIVTYTDLLKVFWNSHSPFESRSKQYQSAILYLTEEEGDLARKSLEEFKNKSNLNDRKIETYIQKITIFTDAEDYHQKYWLRNAPSLFSILKLEGKDDEIKNSTIAAKVNGYLGGESDYSELNVIGKDYGLTDNEIEYIIKQTSEISKSRISCH
uniref:peptide-methionine (S)-S-oxide reductase n=1 Tax=Parastrongyloides trichosuri TaxID=131310 RepID=A0A0N4ZIF5_PARTI